MTTGLRRLQPSRRRLRKPAASGGGFDPTDLPNLAGWWDPLDAATFTYYSGVLISQWDDKSGNSRHLSQATSARSPTRDGAIGGFTAIGLASASSQWLQSTSFTLAQPYTVAFAYSSSGSGVESWIGGSIRVWHVGDETRLYAGSDGGTSIQCNGDHVFVCEFNGASSKLYKDGVDTSYPNNPGTDSITGGFVVSRRTSTNDEWYVNGEMGNIVLVGQILTSGDRTLLTDYLMDSIGI